MIGEREIMELTKDTKVADVFKEYPWLKDELIKMDDKFKMLDSPMAALVLKKATLQDASGKIGLSIDEMAEQLEKMIKARG